MGRYGAVMVMSPNKEMGVEGCRLDHMYIGTKAREEERKGTLRSGARNWGCWGELSDVSMDQETADVRGALWLIGVAARSSLLCDWRRTTLLGCDYIACCAFQAL